MAGEGEATSEDRARTMGWLPKAEFKGAPERWQDANAYLARGEEIMPILKANNQQLSGEVAALRAQNAKISQALTAASESIEELKSFNSQVALDRAKDSKGKLMTALAEAKKEGNTEREVELQDELSTLNASIRESEKAGKEEKPNGGTKQTQETDFTKTPEYQAWRAENASWFGPDRRRTAVAMAVAEELRQDPANAGLVGRAFLDRITAEVQRTFASRTPQQRVEGGGNSGEGERQEKGRTYNDLPPEAKNACEKQAKKLVGEGRAFKTVEDWRKHYVTAYEW